MIRSLMIAKTGLDAQQTQMDVISNNLANVSTSGFKRSRAVFEDLLYQTVRQPGAQSSQQTQLPTGLQLGTGVRPVATERVFTQGNLQQTGNALDVAINGQGFFQVTLPDGSLETLHQEREKFIQEVQNRVKSDLEENGLVLESVSILTLKAARQGSFGTDDVFGASRGIYANPTARDPGWERPCSLELMFPDGRAGFQVDPYQAAHGRQHTRGSPADQPRQRMRPARCSAWNWRA